MSGSFCHCFLTLLDRDIRHDRQFSQHQRSKLVGIVSLLLDSPDRRIVQDAVGVVIEMEAANIRLCVQANHPGGWPTDTAIEDAFGDCVPVEDETKATDRRTRAA